MDYKEAFETLLNKIEFYANLSEQNWKKKFPEGFNRPNQDTTKNMDWYEFEEEMRRFGNERYARGQMIVLGNALKFAKQLNEQVEKSACE